MTALDAAACGAVDSTGQFGETLGLAEHLRDALWRVDSANIAPVDAHGGLIVAGMGGSSVGGRLAAGALGPAAAPPARARHGLRHPGLDRRARRSCCARATPARPRRRSRPTTPPRRPARRGIVATTGGPLAERAREDGVPVVPLPGGFQPRAAVGYSLVTALEAAALCGAAPSLRDEIEAAAALAAELAAEWGPDGDGGRRGQAARARAARHDPGDHRRRPDRVGRLPLEVPDQRERRDPGVRQQAAGARPQRDRRLGGGRAAARRGVPRGPGGRRARRAADRGHGRARRPRAPRSSSASCAQGETRLERLVSLVLLGDLVSLYLAVLRGVDPVHVRAIDTLKERLAAARA